MIITMIITIANRRIETNRRVINHIFVVAVVGIGIYILYTHIFVYNNFLVMFFPSTTLLNLKKNSMNIMTIIKTN